MVVPERCSPPMMVNPVTNRSSSMISRRSVLVAAGRPNPPRSTRSNPNLILASRTRLSVKKAGKAVKDPNKPKRPPSAFFVFMEEFRKTYKEKHPNNKSVAAVGKAAGEKWKSMSEADKAPFVEKAEKRKKEYEKTMVAYNKKLAGQSDDAEEESDKSKSEVNDDDDEDGSDEEDEDDD